MYIKKRWLITAISFVAGGILVLVGLIISLYTAGETYKTEMSYPQKENIMQIAESLEKIDYSLKKGSYAQTPYQAVVLAANVLLETGSAKEDLQHLPVYDLALENTAKYLSQTGEFVFKLAEKSVRGEEITADEREYLRTFSEKATSLAETLRNFSEEVASENYGYDGLCELFKSQKENGAVSAMTNGAKTGGNVFEKIEESFKDFAPIYYDGKYTDIKEKTPDKFRESKKEITKDEAKRTAAFLMDVSEEGIKAEADTVQDDFDCYRFTAQNGDKEIFIIKKGGSVYSYNNNAAVSDAVLSAEDAVLAAVKFLNKAGLFDMALCGTVYNGNILTCTFVSEKNDVLVYPEKLTVGVSLDKGDIVSFVGNEYWKNFKSDRTFTEKISQDEAAKTVSSKLLIKEVNKAVMLSDGGNEFTCYEFITESEKDGQVRVYINTETGNEEKIILVSETEEGTFFN